MVFSTDGGASWQIDNQLTGLMNGNGNFLMQTQRGPTSFVGGFNTGFVGYEQASLVAFSPEDPDILVAGARDAGIFVSTNGGGT